MQLPASDELVLVSGLAPIRAQKLRYYEDRTFRARAIPAPGLSNGPYHDRPKQRSNDWGRLVRKPDLRPTRDAEAEAVDDDGGLQQQRLPGLAEEAPVVRDEPDQANLLGVDDDGDVAADAQAMRQAQALPPVVRAHAINEGSEREPALPSL
jgi:type IV secretion system protein VirD4